MADAVVGVLLQNLNSMVQREFGLLWGVEKDLEKLSSILSTIRAVIEDAEEKQLSDKSIADWLEKLKDASYDADDVFDKWRTKHRQLAKMKSTNTGSTSISSPFKFKRITFRYNMATKLKKIIGRFDEISAERFKFHLSPGLVLSGAPFHHNRETTSNIVEPQVYGRDGDKRNIIHKLLSSVVGQEDVSVFPILGIGGLGKTTVAQLIYNDERVVKHYALRIWVCVSQPFDVKQVLQSIIESIDKKACDLVKLEPLQQKVGEMLWEKKYLLVLDDVWNENKDEWYKLKSFLTSGAKGSSIIITTRLERVATITGTIPTYCLGVLSDDDCWTLFKLRAFGMQCEENPSLVTIGKEIVKRCKGLPLAAKSLGSLLWSKTEANQWKLVRDSEIWNLKEDAENAILAALRLSYYHLSSPLRQCFAYCSIFPKDHEMEKDELIRLWIANGFIQSDGKMEPEEIGEEIFKELLWRCFFRDIEEDGYDNIKKCKMHHLMHDLAYSVMLNEGATIQLGDGEAEVVPERTRHLSVNFTSQRSSTLLDPLVKSQKSLRALFFFQNTYLHSAPSFKFSSLRSLRVLDLREMQLRTLPPSIVHLKHLRYLNLSHTSIALVPQSIDKLRNLQMLDLSGNEELTSLPVSIGNLEHLRYINLSLTNISFLPQSIHRLRNLRRLHMNGNDEITTLPPSIGNLENLRYLAISRCPLVTSLSEPFHSLRNLQMLDLSENKEMVALPLSVGNLESLRYCNLSGCSAITTLPESICNLTNLQSLILSRCYELRALPDALSNMSSLRHLDMLWCDSLTHMPNGIGKLTRLQTLNLFVVGPESDCGGVKELHGLNQLRGELWIKGLEHVRNSEDARKSNLRSKKYLSKLRLTWCSCTDSSLQENNSKKVLEGLKIPSNLQELEIEGYPGESYFPDGFLQNLNALRSLQIRRCNKLKSVPTEVENLTALTYLQLESCNELVSLTDSLLKLASLKKLLITECDSIKSLPVQEPQGLNNSLVDLMIHSCANLTSLSEGLQYLTSLEKLDIYKCPELEFSVEDFQHLNGLRMLRMLGLPKLTALPEGMQHLTMLESLQIFLCENLKMLPEWLPHLTALQNLSIKQCHIELCRRCKEQGEDWHKISHISHLYI